MAFINVVLDMCFECLAGGILTLDLGLRILVCTKLA